MLVQGTGLALIFQIRKKLGHSVRQFMRHHIDGTGEIGKLLAITVAIGHLITVPKGIVVGLAIVYVRDNSESVSVNGIQSERILKILPYKAGSLIGLVRRLVLRRAISLFTYQYYPLFVFVLGIVDKTLAVTILEFPDQ